MSKQPMGVHLRVYDAAGACTKIVGDFESLTLQDTRIGPGMLTLDYPFNGAHAGFLAALERAHFGVVIDGVELPERWVLEDDDDDPAKEAMIGRAFRLSGRGTMCRFEHAVVYPDGFTLGMHDLGDLPQTHVFTDCTPGLILGTLIARMHARGTNLDIQAPFTDTHDTAGNLWPKTYSIEYAAGSTDYLSVITQMCSDGWIDARMVNNVLEVYVPQTELGRDVPNAVLHLGRDVTAAPRQRSRRDIRSHMLVIGDEGAIVETAKSEVATAWGRRESYDGRAGVKEPTTLTNLGQQALAGLSRAREGLTLTYLPHTGGPDPYVDFRVGDFIRYDQKRFDAVNLEPLRVSSIARQYTPAGEENIELELADLFLTGAVGLLRRVDGLNPGVTPGPAPAPKPPAPDPTDPSNDTMPPGPVPWISVSSQLQALDNPFGFYNAGANVQWGAIDTNADGTPITDLASYQVQFAMGVESFTDFALVDPATLTVDRSYLEVGDSGIVRVRGIDLAGNEGAWVEQPFTVATDTTPPPQPTRPTVSNYLGVLIVSWDGKGVNPANPTGPPLNMPPDFQDVQVHLSSVDGFIPSDATYVDHLVAGGKTALADLVYGTTYYVRLVAYDYAGNVSAPSEQASAAPEKVVGDDVFEGIIENRHIVDRAIAGAKIELAAVTAELIADLAVNADKLAANAVTLAKIADGAVDTAKLADAAVKVGKIAANAVTSTTIAAGAISAPKIAANTITANELAANSVTAVQIAAESITAAEIAAGAITASEIAANAIVAGHIAAGQITSDKINAGAITADKIGAGQISADKMVTGTITAASGILANAVIGNAQLGTAVISSAKIQDGAIITAKIDNLAVNDAKIGSLGVGKLTAGRLTATYIELGGKLTTASGGVNSGGRVELDGSGLRAYDSGGANKVNFTNSGYAFINGDLYANMFQSSPGGSSRVEIGNVNTSDPSDHLRMLAGGRYASVRNPTGIPGAIRLTTNRNGVVSAFEYDYISARFGAPIVSQAFDTSSFAGPLSVAGNVSTRGVTTNGYNITTSGGQVNTLGGQVSTNGGWVHTEGGWLSTGVGSLTGASGAQLQGRNKSSNVLTFNWTGTRYELWVDSTRVAWFANGSAISGGTTKSFTIPHPDDPDRYLVHGCLEGPESAVYYRGQARLVGGRAVVTLPGYFESATRPDGRTVHLTRVTTGGARPAAAALAATGVTTGQFTVVSSDPADTDQVCWEVKAHRADTGVFVPEPRRQDVTVSGFGPYTFVDPTPDTSRGAA